MTTFRVERIETVAYWVEYDRDEVLDIISEGYDDVRAEYAEMDDETLAHNLQVEANGYADPVTERLTEDSERNGDVRGNVFSVDILETVSQ